MEIIKFSVIAFMIMMPFMFVSHIQTVSDLHENRMEHFIESAIGQASSDAAYAIKTYSESYYDSGDAYHIDVAHKEVIDVFFDSLSYRDFRYDRSEFPVLAFWSMTALPCISRSWIVSIRRYPMQRWEKILSVMWTLAGMA